MSVAPARVPGAFIQHTHVVSGPVAVKIPQFDLLEQHRCLGVSTEAFETCRQDGFVRWRHPPSTRTLNERTTWCALQRDPKKPQG